MPQELAWEKEYKNPQLIITGDKPQKDVFRFFKFFKKNCAKLTNLSILDLGSGIGKNSNHLARMGNYVKGLEISDTAILLAKSHAKEMKVNVDYKKHNIGSKYPFKDESFDLILDITSSNSLNEKEREIYLSETHRVLKKERYIFVRALCKDGDKNAKNLIKINPGKEVDTYINEDMNLTEKVFTEDSFKKTYSKYFKIVKLIKKTGYTKFKGQSYKRNFWLAYMQKN